jgi:soluble lytic murein transglycosylase-like protein
MGKFSRVTIKVPEVNKTFQSYSTPSTKKSNIAMIAEINSRFGKMCERWGDVFEIDKGVLIGFIATESGGNPKEANFCCYGLMQASPEAVFEAANKFTRTGQPLPDSVRQVLSKIPNLIGAKQMSDSTKNSIEAKLFEPDFNIMCGTMILRWLLERFSSILTGGQLNKAIIGYNAGAYMKAINTSATNPIKTPVDTATYVVMKTVPAETRNYLVKMLGRNGFLELIYKEKVI